MKLMLLDSLLPEVTAGANLRVVLSLLFNTFASMVLSDFFLVVNSLCLFVVVWSITQKENLHNWEVDEHFLTRGFIFPLFYCITVTNRHHGYSSSYILCPHWYIFVCLYFFLLICLSFSTAAFTFSVFFSLTYTTGPTWCNFVWLYLFLLICLSVSTFSWFSFSDLLALLVPVIKFINKCTKINVFFVYIAIATSMCDSSVPKGIVGVWLNLGYHFLGSMRRTWQKLNFTF